MPPGTRPRPQEDDAIDQRTGKPYSATTVPGRGLRNAGAGLVARNYSNGVWTSRSGRPVGTSATEDSPIKAYIKQRKQAGTKGY